MAVPPTLAAAAASLYVGDLHPDVTDGQLFDAFSEFNSLASVRVCRDSSTGRSLCYGYVNFISSQDAKHAIEGKNHTPLNGKVIRVTWSQRDPDARNNGKGNLFVKNLSDAVDNVKLQDIFLEFGNILSCKVVTFEDGKSKGYGFVQYESEESANAAIEKLNGSTVGGKHIYVGKFVRKSDRVLLNPDAKYTNLYMKNLDPDISEEYLKEKLSEFGNIVNLAISKDESGGSRGFGFVNFENADDAKRAMEAMNGSQIGSKVLYMARAQKKAEREQILRRQFEEKRKEQILKYKGSNVYVKNIGDDVTEEELQELFRQCGSITSAKLMQDDKGISKGFGFVCFSTPEEAAKAVSNFHGYMFHEKPLYVAIAQRKEDRKAQLQLQHAQRAAAELVGHSSTFIPSGYPPVYYPRQGMMYQPFGLRPGWRPNSLVHPTRLPFQRSQLPVIPSSPRHNRQNRGRMNGYMVPPHQQQPTQSVPLLKDNQQRSGQARYVPNVRPHIEVNKGSASVLSGASNSVVRTGGSHPNGSSEIFSMLASVSPDQQKQILGEQLYPLVMKHKADLAAKITGMLLEMDNSELLLLVESPESLASKVEEAVQVLNLSKTKLSAQDAMLPANYISAQVAVI